jgi:hypothetical protein
MSISVSPLILDWTKLGLKWEYRLTPKRGPFTIPARSQVQVPSDEYTFRAPEGVLLYFGGLFLSSTCGIKIEASPNLDTSDNFVVDGISFLGASNAPYFIFTALPPKIPSALYGILHTRELLWKEWARLFLINNDSVDHTCFGYAYLMATLLEPRPSDTLIPLQTIEKVRLAYEMYPGKRDMLTSKLGEQLDEWVKKLKADSLEKGE